MSSRKNPRLVKVKTVMSSDDLKLLLTSNAVNSRSVRDSVINSSADIRKNNDDNTVLIQRDLCSSASRLENILEKVLYISCISIFINVVVLCIC